MQNRTFHIGVIVLISLLSVSGLLGGAVWVNTNCPAFSCGIGRYDAIQAATARSGIETCGTVVDSLNVGKIAVGATINRYIAFSNFSGTCASMKLAKAGYRYVANGYWSSNGKFSIQKSMVANFIADNWRYAALYHGHPPTGGGVVIDFEQSEL
ncbi:hypothetical protein [Flexivirga caeni]|uniref:hypothetical protein n=1 Tax=Flexivirga caeni TaxID=2294115 RepID=UPI0011CE0057|nr:hypothetical protein [Flexivirga caeni]